MPHDDFEIEPVRGLPETPPEGEHILWQGAPEVLPLARRAMALRWVVGYFAFLTIWRGLAVGLDLGLTPGLWAASWYLVLGLSLCAIILASAWAFARTTVYTITTQRVAMRVGAALNITLNIPFRWIAKADLSLGPDGNGSIHLDLKGDTRFGYLTLWPHVRPWVLSRTQPTLRCIPDAARVAAILGQAAEARVDQITCEVPVPHAVAAE